MGKLLFILCIFVAQQNVLGQNAVVDNQYIEAKSKKGTARIDALNKYAYDISSYNYQLSRSVSKEAYQLSKAVNYYKGMAEALLYEANLEYYTGQMDSALMAYKESLLACEKANDSHLKGRILIDLGVIYRDNEQQDSAYSNFHRAYQILKDSTNPLHLSFLYLCLSDYYKAINDQQQQLNSLNRCWKIREILNDKLPYVWIGVALASYYTDHGDFQNALFYLAKSKLKLGSDTLQCEEAALINKQKGIILSMRGKHVDALNLFSKAKSFYDRQPSSRGLTTLLMEIGIVQSDIANYETSLKYYFQALKLAELHHTQSERARLLYRIGWDYYLMGQYKLSETAALKALQLSSEKNYRSDEASSANLLGLLADLSGRSEQALDYFNRALTIRQQINSPVGVASTMLNIGLHYERLKNFKLAEDYEVKSIRMAENLGHAVDVSYAHQSLGSLYTQIKLYGKAESHLNQGEALSKKIKANNILLDIYKNKRDLYWNQSNFSSEHQYSILYDNLKDSLLNTELSNRILSLQYDYDLDQKEQEIKLLNQQSLIQKGRLDIQQLEINQRKFYNAVAITIIIILGVVALIIYRFYFTVKQLHNEISEQKEEIQTQAEELSLNNQALEKKVYERTAELSMAYKELDTFFYRSSHDFRRPLTTFMGLAEVARVSITDPVALELFEKVDLTAHNLDRMLFKLQSISLISSQDLVTKEVSFRDIFEKELSGFKEELNQKQIKSNIEVEVRSPFISSQELLSVIVFNLVENAISFSGTENQILTLRASETDQDVVMEIIDNGQGIPDQYRDRIFEMYFRANERSKGNGLGLYIVRKMVDQLKGQIFVKSNSFHGTTVTVVLPKQ